MPIIIIDGNDHVNIDNYNDDEDNNDDDDDEDNNMQQQQPGQ